MSNYTEALTEARRSHRLSYESANGYLGSYWSCSCGARAARRLVPPTGPMADAAARRHVEAVARRIVKAKPSPTREDQP